MAAPKPVPPQAGFEESEIYRAARELRRHIFQVGHFLPEQESFNLANKMRHQALALTNNIAEGCGGKSGKEDAESYQKALSALTRLQDDLNLCLDEGYYREEYLLTLKKETQNLQNKLDKKIKKLQKDK